MDEIIERVKVLQTPNEKSQIYEMFNLLRRARLQEVAAIEKYLETLRKENPYLNVR